MPDQKSVLVPLTADPIEAGPDAGLLDRLVAFTGRSHLS